jgi:hypothetical protein
LWPSSSEVQRQVAEDAPFFPRDRAYERMMSFAWDDGQRTEDHQNRSGV